MSGDVFISCASADAGVARRLAAALALHGISSTSSWGKAIGESDRAIDEARIFVLLLSEQSNASAQVRHDLRLAVLSGLHVVVAVVQDVADPMGLVRRMPPSARLDATGAGLEAQLSALCALVSQRLPVTGPSARPATLALESRCVAPRAAQPPPEAASGSWLADLDASAEEGLEGMYSPGPDSGGRPAVLPAMKRSGAISPMAGKKKPSRWRGWFGRRQETDESPPHPVPRAGSEGAPPPAVDGAEALDSHSAAVGQTMSGPLRSVLYDEACERVLDPSIHRAHSADVDLTLAWPDGVSPGESFVLDLWVHLPQERPDVLESIAEEYGRVPTGVKTKRGARRVRGMELIVRLDIEGVTVDEPEEILLWDGVMVSADFVVTVPGHSPPGLRAGTVTLFAKGMRVSRIAFQLRIVETTGVRSPCGKQTALSHERAFASYASEDRERVLARVQGMETVLPIHVFVDVDVLRASAGRWEDQLRGHIDEASVMYLFWSKAAEASPWVDWEWHYALEKHGLEFIDPVPLEPPNVVAPPPELQTLHFDSKWLAYMREPV